ncbi:2-succinyl-6-hydroxy-2,4-cyclohexadiene-1-carboxylate synthase [Agarivorans gilvus]|uniref:Putative 2-succinyl-6-hydroxy-2,4-cyclohexadiene-1-carboxylate synthase n=1 Tax=Agarivorans gilvus TaxID=680279 RepID=A0ABQ1I3Q5_9ALTE|nr:2-succinyl-6-hydroxy-2,4-cyclohexadiene-1-carboxylate synthase [Agarivorans gilvus]GGB13588.1 2-succinyl-6-hydroxy-2,4-cyclohexadiene-1-carboxylate synthase [Agarivorans gilvus]
MHCSVYGQAQHPCLVLLHGFLGCGRDWQELISQLSQHYYCVTVDIPGHGMSARQGLKPRHAFKDFSQQLSQCLKRLKINQYYLLGYSLGGRLALHHALYAPKGLQHLIIESAHPGLSDPDARQQRLVHDNRWADRWLKEPLDELLQEWYQQPVFANLTAAQRQQLIKRRAQQERSGLAATLRACSLGLQSDLSAQLEQLKMPLDFIGGSLDNKYQGLAKRLQQQHPRLRWHSIEQAGHNCHFEQPTLFLQLLSSVLATTKRKP